MVKIYGTGLLLLHGCSAKRRHRGNLKDFRKFDHCGLLMHFGMKSAASPSRETLGEIVSHSVPNPVHSGK